MSLVFKGDTFQLVRHQLQSVENTGRYSKKL